MRIPANQIATWTIKIDAWLSVNTSITRHDIRTGRDAWTIAHRTDISHDFYATFRDLVDAHLQTALERIFPQAVFKDKKHY